MLHQHERPHFGDQKKFLAVFETDQVHSAEFTLDIPRVVVAHGQNQWAFLLRNNAFNLRECVAQTRDQPMVAHTTRLGARSKRVQ